MTGVPSRGKGRSARRWALGSGKTIDFATGAEVANPADIIEVSPSPVLPVHVEAIETPVAVANASKLPLLLGLRDRVTGEVHVLPADRYEMVRVNS